MDAATWREAGLYDPDAPDAAQRLVLLEHLAAQGLSTEELRAADRQGTLPRFSAGPEPDETLLPAEEVARQVGTTPERLRRARLATGLPWPDDGRLTRDWLDVSAAFELAASLFGEAATLAFTRVLGSAADRVAEAGIAMFSSEVAPGHADAAELAALAARADALAGTIPLVFARVLREHFYAMRVELDAGIGTLAVGFVDLVGSTAWAAQLSLSEHGAGLARFEELAWEQAQAHGGRVVKLIGDEAMFVAADAPAAAAVATGLCAAVAAEPGLPGGRGAVGAGRVMARNGDYFGPLVNLVARCVKLAAPGEVVASGEAALALRQSGVGLTSLGAKVLAGLPDPVELFALR